MGMATVLPPPKTRTGVPAMVGKIGAFYAAMLLSVSTVGMAKDAVIDDAQIAHGTYIDDRIDVDAGQQALVAHTATARDGSFDVELPPGSTAKIVVARPDTMAFYCRYHPTMRGSLVVAR
jgi:plastocyanin